MALTIDGVPYSFINKLTSSGALPNLKKLLPQGTFAKMSSVYPTVSSVAWSSFMTGKNPGGHGIYGFVDRLDGSYKLYIPTSLNMKSETLWEILSQAGKHVVVINVPETYPPRKVNGILVSCFLATDIKKATYPPEIAQKLIEMGYRIDVDPWKGRQVAKEDFLADLNYTLQKRIEVARYFMDKEPWDYFHLHIMETDRINHFLWEQWENNHPQYAEPFLKFYQTIDNFIGELDSKISRLPNTSFLIFSDHGFCTIKKEVYLNYYLLQKGWLKLKTTSPTSITDMHPESKAYSLIPGRIYLHLKRREPEGGVEPGKEYDDLRQKLREDLLTMKDPGDDSPIIKEVYKREELYYGECVHYAPDLVAVPYDGYDLKGNVDKDMLTYKEQLVGMHTYDDAFLYIKGEAFPTENLQIQNVMAEILKRL